jgi:hypothetical protein
VFKRPMVAWKGAGAQMANGGLEGIVLVGHSSLRLVMSEFTGRRTSVLMVVDGENKCLEHWKCLVLVELFAELRGNICSCSCPFETPEGRPQTDQLGQFR